MTGAGGGGGLTATAAAIQQSAWRWWVCGALLLATLLNYMDRQALPQTATELKQRYGLSDERYGRVERNFSWAFAVGSVLFGLLADRWGPRVLYPVLLLGWSAAGLATPLLAEPRLTQWLAEPSDPSSGPYRWLLLCRTLLGLFEAGHWPCALITARQVLAARDRPLGNGILQSGASLGAVLVPLYVMLVRNLGGDWPVVFYSIGAAGLLWVPLWVVLVRGVDWRPEASSSGQEAAASPPGRGRDRFVEVSRMLATLLIVVSCLNVSWQFLRAWLPKYLKESQGFTPNATDGIVAAYYISADLGCLLSGAVVRWLTGRGWSVGSARRCGFALFVGLTAAAAVNPLVGGGWPGVVLLLVAGAGILGLHPFYYALVQELPSRNMGLLSGLLAAVAWFIAGGVQQGLGSHIEATGSYDSGLYLAGGVPAAALLALLLLWPTRGRRRSLRPR